MGDKGPAAQGLAHLLPALHCPPLCQGLPAASLGQELQTRAGSWHNSPFHSGWFFPHEGLGQGGHPHDRPVVN